jgi:hypothetical protein
MRCKCGTGILPVTGKMPVPQVSPLKGQHYIMAIPSEITPLVQRVNQELDQIEQDATEGISLARAILNQFPENFIVVQLLAFLNTSIFYVETSRNWIQTRVEDISDSQVSREQVIQEAGEELARELGRVLETKIRVRNIKSRLEFLQ